MKKLIIAFIAGAIAIAAQAAAYDWSTKTGQNVYLPGTTTGVNGLTAYIFNAGTYSESTLLAAFDANGTIDTTKALGTKITSTAGKLSYKTDDQFDFGNVGDSLTAYFAIVTTIDDKSYLYISSEATATGPGTGYGQLQFASEKTASQAVAKKFAPGSATFGGSGWYTAAVPEPTSGLLLLLGMAGLALKRKQA